MNSYSKIIKPLSNNSGQGMVETMIITLLFLSAIIFAMVQFSMITLGWLRANEAAFQGVRCAVVAKQDEDFRITAQYAIAYVLGKSLPAQSTLWDKDLPGAGKDHSGKGIKMYSVHAYYFQKLMFSSILQPLYSGPGSSFFGGGMKLLDVSRKGGKITGAAHSRMVKPPDIEYYEKAYPDAKNFNE